MPPERLNEDDPAVALFNVPPQVFVAVGSALIIKPTGKLSVTAKPVSAIESGLVIVNESVLFALANIFDGLKDLAIDADV